MTYQELENKNHDLQLEIMGLSNNLDNTKNTLKKYKKENKTLTDYILKKLKDFNISKGEL
tara:strand:- start:4785 stop:4964 length:180 start_codon:yes stop_codon:yes gene_type:complete